jgi:glutamine amidotransferase
VTTLALIDAGGANLGSVRYALERLGVDPRIVRDADELVGAQRVILPGVCANVVWIMRCARSMCRC